MRVVGWRGAWLCMALAALGCAACSAASAQPAGDGGAPAAAPAAPAVQPAPAAEPAADVKLHDVPVFTVRHGHGGRRAAERASAATAALAQAVEAPELPEIRLERRPESILIRAGKEPVIELFAEDAGSEALDVHAAALAARIAEAVKAERRRSEIAGTVLSGSLVVFFGLVALYVLRKIGEFARRARAYADEHPDSIPSIRLQSFEVIGPAAMRGAAMAGLLVGRIILQFGVIYVWIVFGLSLFAATRPLTERLTGFVVMPLSEMTGRLAASLPLLLLAFVSIMTVWVLLRFVRLFFASVARGETRLNWLSAELAPSTSWLVRFGVLASALVFVGPMISGDREGSLARAGAIVLLALGLALTPLLASGILGAIMVFGRRLRVGQRVEIAGRSGRVRELTLLELRLSGEDGGEVRVPHLISLVQPLRVVGERPRLSLELCISVEVPPSQARELLLETAQGLAERASVELVDIDADGGRYRVELPHAPSLSQSELRIALSDALRGAGMPLGRGRSAR
jgi:small-conductance mechanosensitive channel